MDTNGSVQMQAWLEPSQNRNHKTSEVVAAATLIDVVVAANGTISTVVELNKRMTLPAAETTHAKRQRVQEPSKPALAVKEKEDYSTRVATNGLDAHVAGTEEKAKARFIRCHIPECKCCSNRCQVFRNEDGLWEKQILDKYPHAMLPKRVHVCKHHFDEGQLYRLPNGSYRLKDKTLRFGGAYYDHHDENLSATELRVKLDKMCAELKGSQMKNVALQQEISEISHANIFNADQRIKLSGEHVTAGR